MAAGERKVGSWSESSAISPMIPLQLADQTWGSFACSLFLNYENPLLEVQPLEAVETILSLEVIWILNGHDTNQPTYLSSKIR